MGLVNDLVAVVTGDPGITTTAAQTEVAGSHANKSEALRKAKALRLLREEQDPKDKRRKLLYPGEESAASAALLGL
jgi:hypothetical protein